ncbi:MAG: O-antigen ligase family protein, partial [Acidobacteria bacterium]|nr:O-antigen ligase family protein [Acidobacteriota bacterium]
MPRRRMVWLVASASLLVGLYLTGSRSVIGAAACGLVVLVFICFGRPKASTFRGAIAISMIAVVLMFGGFGWIVGHDVAGKTARASLEVRRELVRAGLHVIATRPVFGVGINRFYLVAEGFSSPELKTAWVGRKNPHNDFLRFAGELGLVGLAVFLWIVIFAAARIWRALRRTGDARLAGL